MDDWSCSNEGKPWQGYDNYNGECGLFSKGRTQWGKQEKLQTVTTTQPEAIITSALQGCALNNGWCNAASELSLNGTEPLSGYSILAVEGTLNGQSFACSGDNCAVPLNEGNNDFTFWALSSWGDSSQMGTFSAKVDTVPPANGLDITSVSGSNGWYVSSTSLTATGFDSTSGLSSVFLSVDNGAWQSSTTLNEGVYSVIVQAEDNAGNVAQSPTVISVDMTTPTIDVSVNGTLSNNGWYSSSMEVSATANDATSGVASLESSLDGGGYQAYTSPVSFADGYHTVQFKAVDKAGNETETSVQEFYVDTVAPAVDLPAEWEVNDTITYKVQDDGSGLSALRIVIEDEDEKFAKVAWDEAVSGNKFKGEIMWDGKFKDGTIAPPGEYLVWIKTSDVAGNESIALGRVVVPEPTSLFNLLPQSKSPTEIPTPPADLFVPMDSSPTMENFNPTPSSGTSFGGSTTSITSSNSISVQSLTLASGKSSASTTTSTNVLWGATAAALIGWATATALEEKKKRKEQEQAQAAQVKAQVDAFNEAQEAKRIAQMKQWKINSWLEGQAILNAQIEQLEQQGASPKEIDALKENAKTEGLGVAHNAAGILGVEIRERKMKEAAQADMTEQETWQAYTSTPEYLARQERLAEWIQAEEKKKAQDLQDGLAAYYAATRQGEQETKTNWWDKAIDFVQENIVAPVQELAQAVSNSAPQSIQGGGKLAAPAALDGNLLRLQKLQDIKKKIKDAVFADNDETPTILDRLFNNEWNESRKDLVEALDQAMGDETYSYNEKFLGVGWWNSDLSVDQLQALQALQAYIMSGAVSWDDTLVSIDTLQTYKGYNNAQMISSLRELYYPDALDNFILGAQGLNSSLFKVSGDKNQVAENDAEFARALMLLTTQGDQYAKPLVIIQHPQGYSETDEFEFDHIIAALDGEINDSQQGYIYFDWLDNEIRPPNRIKSVLNFLIGGPIDPLEIAKNRVSDGVFWLLDMEFQKVNTLSAVTWQGDLAGSTAKAYEKGNAEQGYKIEMPAPDFESDILGVVLAKNNIIDLNGMHLASELSTALAVDSLYVANKYSYFADLLGLDIENGKVDTKSFKQFLAENNEMVSDLGTGFYLKNTLDIFSLLPSNQATIRSYAEDQIKYFLQQFEAGLQAEAGK